MITVQEAETLILSHRPSSGTELVELDQSNGRTLAQSVIADRDFPPFNRVAMDGIAIEFKDFNNGQRSFPIGGIQAAGSPQLSNNPEQCLEVMTGACLPENTDTVIRYEDLSIENNVASLLIEKIKPGQNIHKQATDRKKGEVILTNDTLIRPAEIGILATVGITRPEVYKLPSVTVISTGDELVDIEQTPLPHQIRKSNVHTLVALLKSLGIEATTLHLTDSKTEIRTTLETVLNNTDVLMLSGAVSKGKFDFLPEILEELGVVKHFHKVQQRPGKPFWFGTTSSCTVFAFPGNPVSTYCCAIRYFKPWLENCLHLNPTSDSARLTEEVKFDKPLTYFLQVKTSIENGQLLAQPVPGKGSGDLANLTRANAFLEIDKETNLAKKDSLHRLWWF